MRLPARPRVSPQGTAGPRGRSPGAMRGSLLFRCAGALCILLLSLRTDGETENKINDDCTIAWGDLEPDVEYKTVEFETSTSWISPLIEIARFYIDITLDEILPPGKQLSPFFRVFVPKNISNILAMVHLIFFSLFVRLPNALFSRAAFIYKVKLFW